MTAIETKRPKYLVSPILTALDWDWSGYHVSEKMDGVWHDLVIGSSTINGELMPDGRFFAFDIPVHSGEDVRSMAAAARLSILNRFKLLRPAAPRPSESPAQFIQRILKAGGEGIVAKELEAPYGVNTYKVKRSETFDCIVTEKHPIKQSLHLLLDGQDAGWCACMTEFNRVQVGDVVEVGCMKRHSSGKLREPRFIRLRPDLRA